MVRSEGTVFRNARFLLCDASPLMFVVRLRSQELKPEVNYCHRRGGVSRIRELNLGVRELTCMKMEVNHKLRPQRQT